jgi:triosephosphate isomerase
LVNALKADLANFREVETVVCPPFTALATVSQLVQGTHIDLGAQNMHWEKGGAYTGEICASMLRELYCHYVILGHSERRQYFGETDAIVNRKTKAAWPRACTRSSAWAKPCRNARRAGSKTSFPRRSRAAWPGCPRRKCWIP